VNSISNRIKELISKLRLSNAAFATSINIQKGSLYNIVGPRGSSPSADLVAVILDKYPQVRPEWLMKGAGPMFFGQEEATINPVGPAIQVEEDGATYGAAGERDRDEAIPFVPVAAEGSYLNGFGDEEYIEHLPKFYLPFLGLGAGVYAFQVRGDSMSDRFNNGDVVFGQKVEKNDALRWGEVYVLLCNDGLVVKELRRGPTEEYFTLRSYNEHFDPYEILRTEVRAMFRYQASINFNSSNPNRGGVMRFLSQLTQQMADLQNSLANLPQLK